jgi:hypothetical protein
MARYLVRSRARCHGYLAIVQRQAGRNTPVQAINGKCAQCGYRLAWIVIREKELLASRYRDSQSPNETALI